VGHNVEPAFSFQPNAVYLRVRTGAENGYNASVAGLGGNLFVTMTVDGHTQTLPMSATFTDNSVYLANYIPTSLDAAVWEFLSNNSAVQFDQTFTCGVGPGANTTGQYGCPDDVEELYFPEEIPTPLTQTNQITALQTQVLSLNQSLTTAQASITTAQNLAQQAVNQANAANTLAQQAIANATEALTIAKQALAKANENVNTSFELTSSINVIILAFLAILYFR